MATAARQAGLTGIRAEERPVDVGVTEPGQLVRYRLGGHAHISTAGPWPFSLGGRSVAGVPGGGDSLVLAQSTDQIDAAGQGVEAGGRGVAGRVEADGVHAGLRPGLQPGADPFDAGQRVRRAGRLAPGPGRGPAQQGLRASKEIR